MGFIHISSRLAVKHKTIDWQLDGATYQKIQKIKIVEKYSLSYWYYKCYSYLQQFGRKTQKKRLAARWRHLLKNISKSKL